MLQRLKAQTNTCLPFCQEVQGLQRGRVQGQDSNLHRHHWWGGILQRESLDLKQTENEKQIDFISIGHRQTFSVLPCSHWWVLHQSQAAKTSPLGASATYRNKKVSYLEQIFWGFEVKQLSDKDCVWGSPAGQLVFAALPARAELRSQFAVNRPRRGEKVWEEGTLPLSATWRVCETQKKSATIFCFEQMAFGAATHLFQTIWGSRAARTFAPPQT